MIRFLLLLLMIADAYALDAVVTVLEAPLFREKSLDAPVVQYLRKGDVIHIHPSVGNDPSMDRFAPSKGSAFARGASLSDEFISTLDRQGRQAYVLSDHIFVYFNDAREFDEVRVAKDPTDYRLEEPLPKNYPFKNPSGYRGQFLLGFTQPYYESYDYKESVKKKGYQSPVDFNFTLLRQAPGNYQQRLFIGGTVDVRFFGNNYTFSDGHTSNERGLKLGLGPTISYDAYKGEKNRINISGGFIVNLFNQLTITQDSTTKSDSRTYRGYSLSPRLNFQYHRKQVLEDIDFVLGTSMEMETATSFKAINGGSQLAWWRHLGDDKFTTRPTFTLGAYIGLQTAY